MTRRCSYVLVTKDKAGLDVSGVTTDILSDCLDTLRANDADSVEIEGILWVKIAVVSWDATKSDKRTCVRFSKNSTKHSALHSCNTSGKFNLTCKMSNMCYRDNKPHKSSKGSATSCVGCSDG